MRKYRYTVEIRYAVLIKEVKRRPFGLGLNVLKFVNAFEKDEISQLLDEILNFNHRP